MTWFIYEKIYSGSLVFPSLCRKVHEYNGNYYIHNLHKQTEDKFAKDGVYSKQLKKHFQKTAFDKKFFGEVDAKNSFKSISERLGTFLELTPSWINMEFR